MDYEEPYNQYMRDILGYNLNNNYTNYISRQNLIQNQNLENLYPEVYTVLYPLIKKKCEEYKGEINKTELESLATEIKETFESNEEEKRNENNLINDLIKILLIREFTNRNKPPRPQPQPQPRPPMLRDTEEKYMNDYKYYFPNKINIQPNIYETLY